MLGVTPTPYSIYVTAVLKARLRKEHDLRMLLILY